MIDWEKKCMELGAAYLNYVRQRELGSIVVITQLKAGADAVEALHKAFISDPPLTLPEPQ